MSRKRRAGGTGAVVASGDATLADQEWSVLEDQDAEMSAEELQEFMAGDLYGSMADPAFKEQLRQKLWSLVRERYGSDEAE